MITLLMVGLGIIICVILSGYFSASEMSISSCNTVRLENEAKNGNKRAKKALKLNENYDDTLSAILLSNNLVNIAASSLSTVYIILLTGTDDLNWLITIIVTVLVIIFGETVPKILSKRHANTISCFVAGTISTLIVVLKPINYIVVGITNIVTKGLDKYSHEKGDDEEVVEELQAIIETAEDEGVLDSERSDLVSAAIDFQDISAHEIMTARVDVEAIDIDDSMGKIKKQIIGSTRSRMPVYEGSIDNVIGIIHLNHLLKAFAKDNKPDIRALMMEPCFVYKTAKLPHVLDVLKKSHIHLAIVTDEYSGTCGVVSMEDVLEEIVGDIWDETDEIEEEVVEESDGKFIIDGDMLIDDFLELIDIDSNDFDYESQTVGGWTIEYMGDFPKAEDSFEYEGYVIRILEADARRVEKIEVYSKNTDDIDIEKKSEE